MSVGNYHAHANPCRAAQADNVAVSVASNPTTAELEAADASVVAAWVVQLVSTAISLFGLMGGFSMFMHGLGLLQIVCQLCSGVLISLFVMGSWHIAALWYIVVVFGLLPALLEAAVIGSAVVCRSSRQ